MKNEDDDVKRDPGGGEIFEPWVEPAMEVRLVALALGEASEFERAELEAAMVKERELKLFYDRICGADSLMGEMLAAGAEERSDEWRMTATRREAVLERIRGSAAGKADELVGDAGGAVGVESAGRKRGWIGNLGSIAAALVALLAIGGLFLPTGAGFKSSMMPAAGAVRERYDAKAERSLFLFDASEPDTEMQLALPTAMPESRVRGFAERRYAASAEGDRGEDGLATVSNGALFKEMDRPAIADELLRSRTSATSLDALADNKDFGLAVDESARAEPETPSEVANWGVPRLASVPPPTEAPANKVAADEGRENMGDFFSEAKTAKVDGGMGGGGATAGFYEERFGDKEPNQDRWRKRSELGRSAGQDGFNRGAAEAADGADAVADARLSGAIGGAGGGGGSGDRRVGRRLGEGIALGGVRADVDGDGVMDLAKGTKSKLAEKPAAAAAGSGARDSSLAENQEGWDSGVDAKANHIVAAIEPDDSLRVLSDDLKTATVPAEDVTGFASAVDPAPMPAPGRAQTQTAPAGEPERFENRSGEDPGSESLSSRLTRNSLARGSVSTKSRELSRSEAAITGMVAELEEESESIVRELAPEISSGVVPIRAVIDAETDDAGGGVDLYAQQVMGGEEDGRKETKSLEGQTKWFDDSSRQKAAQWGRPGSAMKNAANQEGEKQKFGPVTKEKGTGTVVSGGGFAGQKPESMTATRDEVPASGPAVMNDDRFKLIDPPVMTGTAGFGLDSNKRVADLAQWDESGGVAANSTITILGSNLTRDSVSKRKLKADVDFDVEVDEAEMARAKQPASLSFFTAVDDVDRLAAAEPGEDPADGLREAYKSASVESAKIVNFSVSGKTEAIDKFQVWEQATTELETATAEEAFSTFSLHVSDVAFKLAAAALLEAGTWPEVDKIRVEEFVNAFDYGDPGVTLEEKVGCKTEQAAHPFLQQRNLVRVSMRAAAAGRTGGQPLRLTVLLDKSGSMEREDREAAVAKAMDALASHLTGDDVITVIGFARTPRLIADRMSGERAGELAGLVAQAPSEGGTNLEEALVLGRQMALRQHLEGGMNRIVLMTDGAANLGDASPEKLNEMVVRLRNEGVAFDACGVGADGLNDEILEALTREGDGRYYFLNRAEDADEGFVRQLAGALRPAAKNVKVQVEFNPERVRGYRLLGFEKHRLEKEDFRNDAVDAAEMAAEEAGVAVYQTEVIPDGTGDVGKVWVRFQDTVTGEMVERSWGIPYEARAPRLSEAPAAMKLAATAVLLGERLKGGAGGELVDLAELAAIGAPLRQDFAGNQRVEKLIRMIEAARNLEQ